MITIHPENHLLKEVNRERSQGLLEAAKRGELFLLLEDHTLVAEHTHENIQALEPSAELTIDQILSILHLGLDPVYDTLWDLKSLGKTVFALYVLACTKLCEPCGTDKTKRVQETVRGLTLSHSSMDKVILEVAEAAHRTLGGIPAMEQIEPLRTHVDDLIWARTSWPAVKYSIFHSMILREAQMGKKALEVLEESKLPVHLVVGANHVSVALEDEDLRTIKTDTSSKIRWLQEQATELFPGKRLTDILQGRFKIEIPSDREGDEEEELD